MENNEKTSILKEQVALWKAKLEELELQLSLGKMEAADEFDEQKKNLNDFIGESAKTMDGLKEGGFEKGTEMKAALEGLQVQLALGKAETKEAFEAQKEKIEASFDFMSKQFDAVKDSADEQTKNFFDLLEAKSTEFKAMLETSRVQYALGKAEAKEAVTAETENLKQKTAELKSKLESAEEAMEGKWDEFSEDMSKAYTGIFSAFKKLIS